MGTASSVQRVQVPIGCYLCQGRNTIQWKCLNCQLLMCTSCKDNIHLRIAKDHRIINIKDIGELESGESFNFDDASCDEHSNQVCCSYCRTCATVVCVKCVMTVHNGHTFVDEEEFLSKKKKLWEGPKRAVIKLMELSKAETKLKQIKNSEDALYNKAKQDIQEIATNDVDQFSEILTKLDNKTLSINQEIDRQLRNIVSEKEKFQDFIKIVDEIKSSKDFYQFFEKFDELITSLNCDTVHFKSNIESLSDFSPISVEDLIASNAGQLTTKDLESKISFKISKRYTTDIRKIICLIELKDHTLLISDNQSKVLQHVLLKGTSVQVIANFSIKIFGMAVSPAGDVLVSTNEKKLKVFNIKTGEVTDSVYNVHRLKSRHVHVTKDNRVIIGARSAGPAFPVTGRRVVIVMDQEGKHLKKYEYDSNNKPLFTCPRTITSTSNGNIFVIDKIDADYRGRVVVLEQGGDVIQIYSGYPHVNTENKPFTPVYLLAMASGSVIVTELNIETLHILNNCGQLISYLNLLDFGIKRPFSLAVSLSGHLYVGCTCKVTSSDTHRAKLYELKHSGI